MATTFPTRLLRHFLGHGKHPELTNIKKDGESLEAELDDLDGRRYRLTVEPLGETPKKSRRPTAKNAATNRRRKP